MFNIKLFICLSIIIVVLYFLQHTYSVEKFTISEDTINTLFEQEIKNLFIPFEMKNNYDSIIPLNLFQTWCVKDLPPKMKENCDKLKADNPEFKYYLFDDNDCRIFIKNNFNHDVLKAYDTLIPGAYKADLWRCCVLYKFGGIYLDIKYRCTNEFKLIALTENEYFCNDWSNKTTLDHVGTDTGIYNAIMICLPDNQILKQTIDSIVNNVKNKYYGNNPLEPTGPLLMKKLFTDEQRNDIVLNFYKRIPNKEYIRFNNIAILDNYPEYRQEQKLFAKTKHYHNLWNEKNIYK